LGETARRKKDILCCVDVTTSLYREILGKKGRKIKMDIKFESSLFKERVVKRKRKEKEKNINHENFA